MEARSSSKGVVGLFKWGSFMNMVTKGEWKKSRRSTLTSLMQEERSRKEEKIGECFVRPRNKD
jgi:hypothetical protein